METLVPKTLRFHSNREYSNLDGAEFEAAIEAESLGDLLEKSAALKMCGDIIDTSLLYAALGQNAKMPIQFKFALRGGVFRECITIVSGE